MKKIFFSLLMAFAIFFVNVDNAEAQCPAGYNTVTQRFIVNGCEYDVDLCYNCPVTGYSDGYITLAGGIPIRKVISSCNTSPSLNTQGVISYLLTIIGSPELFNVLCETPDCNAQPPVPKKKSFVKKPICWKVKNEIIGMTTRLVYIPCDPDAYCLTVTEYCRDYTFNPPKLMFYNLGSTEYGNPECDFINYDPAIGLAPGQESGCFRVSTACD